MVHLKPCSQQIHYFKASVVIYRGWQITADDRKSSTSDSSRVDRQTAPVILPTPLPVPIANDHFLYSIPHIPFYASHAVQGRPRLPACQIQTHNKRQHYNHQHPFVSTA